MPRTNAATKPTSCPPIPESLLRTWLTLMLQGKTLFFKRGGVTLWRPDVQAHLFIDLPYIRIVVAPAGSGGAYLAYAGPLDRLGKKTLKPIRRLYDASCAMRFAVKCKTEGARNDCGVRDSSGEKAFWFNEKTRQDERGRFREATRAQSRSRGVTASEDVKLGKSISHSTDLE